MIDVDTPVYGKKTPLGSDIIANNYCFKLIYQEDIEYLPKKQYRGPSTA